MQKKVALITGASSGIGAATAKLLSRKGFIVYAAARRVGKMKHLEQYGIHTIYLDITEEESITHCVNTILSKEGRVDVLINNAGYGSYGAIEDVPISEAKRQLEVNLFGLARITQLVLPSMRKNHWGKIVNISSMAGKVTTPFGGWYHTAKFALEGFSDCLRMELAPFGIDVIIIEPGAIKTDWGIIAAENLKKVSVGGPYAKKSRDVADNFLTLYSGNKISKPELISNVIVKAVMSKKPKTRYLLGYGAKLSVASKRILPDRIYDKIIMFVLGR